MLKRFDLFTLKCWLAILIAYLERQQDDKFVTHAGDIVWLPKEADEERYELPL